MKLGQNTKMILVVCCGALLALATAAAPPVVFQVSEPVGPGETALLFGDGIGPAVQATGWRVPDATIVAPPAKAVLTEAGAQPLAVLQASDLSAKVLLPADWKPGLFAVRLTAANGTGAPVFLNRTQPWWWLGGEGETAFAGETIRVFGNNFGEKTRAWLAGKAANVELPVLKAEKYTASFRVPATLPPGDYALWLHNGYGGDAGFGGPLAVRVAHREPWPTTQFNVRDCGAKGDAANDDTPAFAEALAKAGAQGGGVVFVPRGTYKITAKLVIPAKTTLRGEKRELVWLYAPKELPEFDTVLAGNGDFAVEELSIVSQTARRLIACPDAKALYAMPWGHEPTADQMGRNAHLRRLRLQHLRYAHRIQDQQKDPRRLEGVGPSTVVLAGPDMELSDSEVVSAGMPIVLMNARHCRVEGNRLDTGRNGWYGLWTAEESVFANNLVQARDLEGSYGGVQNKAYRLHFSGNTWRDAYGDEREALTFDTPYHPTWMGRVGSVKDTVLTAREYAGAEKTWKPGALRGQVCLIAFGKGLGQYIPIADNTETTITLTHPFAVPPDETSHLVVRVNKSEVVITGNSFADASAAVQLYAQSFGFIVDGNRAERTGGMYGIGGDAMDQRGRRRYSTCSFNQWLNNDLSEGFIYQQGAFMYGVLGPCAGGSILDPPAIAVIGNIVRHNRVRDRFTIGALAFGAHPFKPAASSAGYFGRDTIIEGNDIADTPLALDVYPLYRDTLLRNNHVKNAAVPLRDDGANTWIQPAERLRYQIQAVAELLGDKVHLGALESAAAAPAADVAALRAQLWAETARATAGRITPELLMTLAGFSFEFDANSPVVSALSTGKPGKAEIRLRARTAPWSPEIGVALEVEPPAGWQLTKPAAPVALQPFEISNLKAELLIPADADVRALPIRLTLTLGSVALTVAERLDLSRRDLANWMVLGPLPDTGVHPAEARLDLNATYFGPGGEAKWQPVGLPNKYLHLDALLHPAQPATALAVSCLRADQAATIELSFSCHGAAQFLLNNAPVATLAAQGGQTVRLNLDAGDNILYCKASTKDGPWEIAAEFKELTGDASSHVRQVPVAELKSVKALVPPPPKPMRAGAFPHDAGVAWRPVLADNFNHTTLGEKWRAASGTWLLKNGVLAGGDRAFIAFAEKLRAPVRIEYEVQSQAPQDMSAFWLRDPADINSGWVFAFASGESGSRIQIEGSVEAHSDATDAKAAPNRWYQVIAQVLPDGTAQLIVDGKLVLSARGNAKQLPAAFPGLWTWGGAQFRNARISTAASVAQ